MALRDMCTVKLVFIIAFSFLCCSVEIEASAHFVANANDTVSGCDDYVAYHTGGHSGWPPIVLSAPHGGLLRPSTIPDRDAGCWVEAEDRCEYTHSCGVKDYTR